MTALPDRSAVRAEFAALLTAGMTGPGKLAQTVYPYTVKDFGAKMPVLVVGSAGTGQSARTRSGITPAYRIDLWVFVLYAAVAEDGTLTLGADAQPVWDEADSELALDQIEAAVRALIDSNQRGAAWQVIDYASDSTVDIIPVGDQSYRRELIPLKFSVF